jgi:hypothetical protein
MSTFEGLGHVSEDPDILTVTTGGEEEVFILKQRDEFFSKILSRLDIEPTNPFVKIKSNSLGFEDTGHFYPTDDIIHLLEVVDEVVACVVDRRDDWNMHQVTFFNRIPSPRVQKVLKTLKKSGSSQL